MDDSKQLIQNLKGCKREVWGNIVTSDQSWISINTLNLVKMIVVDEEGPKEVKGKLDIQKVMLTVIWGVNGLYAIDFLPPSVK